MKKVIAFILNPLLLVSSQNMEPPKLGSILKLIYLSTHQISAH